MKKRILIALGCLAMSVSIFYMTSHLGFNRSNSLDFTLYWHKPIKGDIQKGRYYLIEYKDDRYSGLINKKVACISGETVVRVNDMFLCNGNEFITTIKLTHDRGGNAYPQYMGRELVESAFVIGDKANSYDSRYFGAVPIANFKREVTPLW
jgi:conjugal transfer pilin signal peptidase TrbI